MSANRALEIADTALASHPAPTQHEIIRDLAQAEAADGLYGKEPAPEPRGYTVRAASDMSAAALESGASSEWIDPAVKRLLDKIRQQRPAVEQEIAEWKDRALAVEAELAALREDRERWDWLEKHIDEDFDIEVEEGASIRAAIDAARKEQSL